jgi:hypothetical protein
MFQMIGAGEKAGSGFPRIVQAWRAQHWRAPLLEEDHELYETHLTLTTVSLFPLNIVEELERRFPEQLAHLEQEGRLALATALLEGRVSNNRLQEITERHSSDLTEILRNLVQKSFLQSHGRRRWTWYTVQPGLALKEESESSEGLPGSSEGLPGSSEGLLGSSEGLLGSSEGLLGSSEGLPGSSEGLPGSSEGLLARLDDLPTELLNRAAAVRARGKINKDDFYEIILALCQGRYLPLRTLSEILGRSPDYIRPNFLRELVKNGQLEILYPDRLNHPDQAYRTHEKRNGEKIGKTNAQA